MTNRMNEHNTIEDEAEQQLKKLREEKKKIDEALLELAAKRIAVAKKIGAVKRDNGLPIRDENEEEIVLAYVEARCEEIGISSAFGNRLMKLLIEEALRTQGFDESESK